MKTIKIALVEDQTLFRDAIKNSLADIKDLRITLSTGDGHVLLNRMKTERFDVVITDLDMDKMDGFELIEHVKAVNSRVPILVLTKYDKESFVSRMIGMGADGYLVKDIEIEDLLEAIRNIVKKKFFISGNSKSKIRSSMGARNTELTGALNSLTDSEIELIKLVCMEYTGKEIAEKLNLSKKTIDNRRRVIYGKLQVSNTAGLVLFAVKAGIVE